MKTQKRLNIMLICLLLMVPSMGHANSFEKCLKDYFSEGIQTNHQLAMKILNNSHSEMVNILLDCYKQSEGNPKVTRTKLFQATRISRELFYMAEISLGLEERFVNKDH